MRRPEDYVPLSAPPTKPRKSAKPPSSSSTSTVGMGSVPRSHSSNPRLDGLGGAGEKKLPGTTCPILSSSQPPAPRLGEGENDADEEEDEEGNSCPREKQGATSKAGMEIEVRRRERLMAKSEMDANLKKAVVVGRRHSTAV